MRRVVAAAVGLLADACFPAGVAYGSTDERGTAPTRDACSPDDLAATLSQRPGFGPRHDVRSSGGRPIPIFREGRCLEAPVG